MNKLGYEQLSNELVENETLELQAQGENLDAIIHALPLQKVKNVLDVGCGSGALTRALARFLGPNVSISGVDISSDHIDFCKQESHRQGLQNINFFVGNILENQEELFNSFDLIYCRYLMMYMLPKNLGRDCLLQMKRYVRPGGKLVCIEPDVNFGQERYPAPPETLSKVLAEIVTYYRKQGLIEWRSGIRLFDCMKSSGLLDVEVKLVDGRILQGGTPSSLVEHDSQGVEELIRPCLEQMGNIALSQQIDYQWKEYLRNPNSFLYTPIFMGVGNIEK
jgi:ubiquinone/menaquinone biosynthesis C-methylase UbiE